MGKHNDEKPHYVILDGLRGIAAMAVLGYHLLEAVAFAAGAERQSMYHGFLAVDFFFILSGFVMGYAYDNRWGKTLTLGGFVQRRLIRLHPMVVMGVVLGIAAFCLQGCVKWDGTQTSIGSLLLSALLALFLIPSPLRLDVRGNTEMFPLNGPHWSLFFEYIGSFLYGILLHRLSTKMLKGWVVLAALAMLANGLWQGEDTIAYGWSSIPSNMLGGFLRLSFGYPAGLLMARLFRAQSTRTSKVPVFLLCTIALLALLSVPYLGAASVWYQTACVCLLFPAIILFAAKGIEGRTQRAANLLGRLSYPLYAIHYPLIYLYIDWINRDLHPFGQGTWNTPAAIALIAILLAALCMKFYDEPLRKKLQSIWR